MAEITKKKYKEDLKTHLKEEIKKVYKKDEPNKGLRYWIEWNKTENAKFENALKAKGDTVKK